MATEFIPTAPALGKVDNWVDLHMAVLMWSAEGRRREDTVWAANRPITPSSPSARPRLDVRPQQTHHRTELRAEGLNGGESEARTSRRASNRRRKSRKSRDVEWDGHVLDLFLEGEQPYVLPGVTFSKPEKKKPLCENNNKKKTQKNETWKETIK